MYVSEICAEGIFVTFPWWLKNVKSRSKIAIFSNKRHFEIWFPKKRTITFFWSKLTKLHKKDPILHVATKCSLKQGETRTSHGPIPHPLINRPLLTILSTDKNRRKIFQMTGIDLKHPTNQQKYTFVTSWWNLMEIENS